MADMNPTLLPSAPTGENAGAPWHQAILGPPGPSRQAIRRLLWLCPTYLFISALLTVGVHLQRIEAQPAWLLSAYSYAGLLTFYVLLRGGWAQHQVDPALTFAQVLFSIGAVWLAYATMEVSRVLALQWLCLILAFDMHRLHKRQVRNATLIAVAGLSSIVAWDLITQPDRFNVIGELINIGMASVTLPILVLVSGLARRMRKQSHQQHVDMAEALAQMQALAVRDGLTRAFTRRHMQQLLDEEAARQRRTRRIFCVAMLDIDWFKKVNDQHGHAVGDAVLVAFTQCVQGTLDKGHALARWGGEEFLLLMPDTSLLQALQTLGRIRLATHQHDWGRLAPGLRITFSCGVSQHVPGDKIDHVVNQADQALYTAKAAGRDRVQAADPASR